MYVLLKYLTLVVIWCIRKRRGTKDVRYWLICKTNVAVVVE